MSNELAPHTFGGKAAKELQAKASDIALRIGAESSSLRLKGNKRGFIVVGDDEYEEIQLVVVDFIAKRTFYKTPYRESDPYRPPTCYGIARSIDGMTPHPNVNEIGGEKQSDDCKTCPLNEWKSDPNGGNGKACKERRVMVVLPPGADHTSDDFWELDVGPTSIKSFDNFVRNVWNAWKLPPVAAVVTLSMDQSVDYQKYVFSNPVPNEFVAAHSDRMDAASEYLAKLEYGPAEDMPASAPKRVAKKKAARRG